MRFRGFFFALALFTTVLTAQDSDRVLVVVNQQSSVSRQIGAYYVHKRRVPSSNVCTLDVSPAEEISRDDYNKKVEAPLAAFLRKHHAEDQILYIVTTLGVPLKIAGSGPELQTDAASVDSELTLLYASLKGSPHRLAGPLRNPLFGQQGSTFSHAIAPIYLVTRLAGYDFDDVRGMIDRSLDARNTGKFVVDLRADNNLPGNAWLRAAADKLPKDRLVLEETGTVAMGQKDVIAYASWGSNDPDRKTRELNFRWLPGAIVTEFVSTNARTFARPPANWTLGTWQNPASWFAGAPQTLSADYIHSGATGCSGHVYEPYLHLTPRPDFLLPAYYSGRNLAESYYASIPALSWMNVVLGDPLCALGKPVH